MTSKEKDLLLKDLCARLPYGVIVQYTQKTFDPQGEYTVDVKVEFDNMLHHRLKVLDCKPYLRPMSSMTEEEKEELRSEFGADMRDEDNGRHTEIYGYVIVYHNFNGESWYIPFEAIDWLNAHHFDYRGLIEKGLALEAPEGMYK